MSNVGQTFKSNTDPSAGVKYSVGVTFQCCSRSRNSEAPDLSAGFLNLRLQKRWLQAFLLVKGNRHSPSQYRHPRSALHRRLEVSGKIKTLFTLMLRTGTAAQRQKYRKIL